MDSALVCAYLCLNVVLPPEVCLDIVKRVNVLNKDLRRLPREILGRGRSRSAFKRRCAKIGCCSKCGKCVHQGNCSKNQTYSQWEVLESLQRDPIRLKAEKSLRRDSNAFYHNVDLVGCIERFNLGV
jgi:hypothetical protein